MTNEFLEAAETVGGHFVSGIEANALLFILDTACETSLRGEVNTALDGLTLAESKRLRDKLFSIHEYRPGWDYWGNIPSRHEVQEGTKGSASCLRERNQVRGYFGRQGEK
jgi:hypothetical protein